MPEQKRKNDSGALFRNDRKEGEKHPDYKGSALVGGVEYWIAGWVNTSQQGTKYLSLAFTKRTEKGLTQDKSSNPKRGDDDDLPF